MGVFFRRHGAALLAIVIISTVFFGWSATKSGFFIDEIYSYGLSNSDFEPFINKTTGGTYPETIITRDGLLSYVTIDEDEGFDVDSVFYNQKKDVHPPLYYLFLNAASSLVPGVFSKWCGLLLNYVFFILTLCLIYRICEKLFDDRRVSVGVMLLYGLSAIGLSTALMVRMYSLSTLLTVLLAYLALSHRKNPGPITAAQAGLTVCLGLLTHYFFVIYAAVLCVSVMICHLTDKRPREAFRYLLGTVVGGLSAYIVFPAMIEHLFADKLVSAGTAVANLKNLASYPKVMAKYILYTVLEIWIPVIIGVAFAVILAVIFIRAKKSGEVISKSPCPGALMITVPAFVAFLISAVISPVFSLRYIYNLIPLFVIFVGFLAFHVVKKCDTSIRFSRISVPAAAVLLALNLALSITAAPEYIHGEQKEFNEILKEYSDSPCIYFTKNIPAAVTQDLSQLMIFDDVAITKLPEGDTVVNYLASKGDYKSIVVFVDVDRYWSSGLDADNYVKRISILTGLESIKPLYSYGLSEAYLVYSAE